MPSTRRGLLAFTLAYNAGHHLGLLPGGLGPAGGATRWGDWLDLLVPYAVVGTALLTLAAAGGTRREWAVGLGAAVAYAQGAGIHLAANSIGNARGAAPPVHLWDELVGHAVQYGGVALLLAVLARACARDALPVTPVGLVLALVTGLTWATNALGADGLAPAGLVVAVALAGHGAVLRRTGAGRLLLAAFVPSALALAAVLVVGWTDRA